MSRRDVRTSEALAVRRATPGYVEPPAAPPVAKPKVERRETGLMVLRRTNKLEARQVRALERYGELWRMAAMEGDAMLPSSLAALDSVGGVSPGGGLPATKLAPAELRLAVKRDLLAAQNALGFETAMIAACDVIAGRQWTLSEVTHVRREAEAIATLLWVAANLLIAHFGA